MVCLALIPNSISGCEEGTAVVSTAKRYLVSASGQMSLPAEVRHRWHLDSGGPVEVLDLGFGVLTVPVGQAAGLLRDLLSREEQADFVAAVEDPDLKTT